MKVKGITNNNYLKTAGLFALLAVSVALLQKKCAGERIEKYKTEIKSKANSKHFQSMAKEADKKGIILQEQYWSRKLQEINDWLKIDSASKKAYFEGAQMVRDSIAKIKGNLWI